MMYFCAQMMDAGTFYSSLPEAVCARKQVSSGPGRGETAMRGSWMGFKTLGFPWDSLLGLTFCTDDVII